MKKTFSIISVVLILLLSVVPAFAATDGTVRSPHGDDAFTVIIHPTQGGTGDWYYTTEPAADRSVGVHIYAIPNEGYTFDHWEVKGSYTANQSYSYLNTAKISVPVLAKTDANGNDDALGALDLTISGDVEATPYFKKTGTDEVATGTPKADDSSKSPKTGTDTTMLYVVVGLTLLMAAAGVVTATVVVKKRK